MKENKSYDTQQKGALGRAIKSLAIHLTPAQKRKMIALFVLIFLSAIVDVFGLASILPLIRLAGDPSALHHNKALQWIYVHLHFSSDNQFLLVMIFAVLVFFIFKSVFGYFVNYLQTRFSWGVAQHITQHQFSKYFSLDFHRFTALKSSVITHHIVNNPLSYVTWVVLPLIMIMSEGTIVLLIITGISIYDFKLFLFLTCVIGPATWLIFALMKNKSTRIGRELNKLMPMSLGQMNQVIQGYIDIKLSEKENYYKSRFLKVQSRLQKLNMDFYLQNLVPQRANELIALLGVVLIFLYAIFLTDNHAQAILMVSVFAAAAYRLMPSTARIVTAMVQIRKNTVAMDNLSLFNDEFKDESKKVAQVPLAFHREIVFDHLSFSFPGKKESVLKDISFQIRKGEKIGIVGTSGSGKTTLMNVLLRFYKEDKGAIKVDGVPLGAQHLSDWRKKIGYVKQDIFLLDGTIKENIAFGDDNVNEELLMKAIRQASLDKLVSSLPDGVETSIGEKGSRLSGGQRQRISIARSLYRNAEVLIFDEATSALDNETEIEVTEAIDKLSEVNKTIFIIAHRITTLRNCDRIYDLKDGEITGVYSYAELVEKVI